MCYADMVIINGKVVTVDKYFSFKKAIAVKDGWIINVGENADIKPYIGPDTQVVDLKGKMILPGAHDAHMHGIWYGVSKPPIALDLSYPNIESIADIKEKVAKKAKELPRGTWIKGVGFTVGHLLECKNNPGSVPRKIDFDDVTPDHPIALYDFSLHTLVVNSKALEICGVDRHTPDPSGGEIERDGNGNPTGVFREFEAQGIIMKHFPRLTDEELKLAIKYTQKELNKNGITSYNDSALGPGGDLTFGGALGQRAILVYGDMAKKGEMTARVSIGLLMGDYGALNYEDVVNGFNEIVLPEIIDENWMNIPMLKIFADGIPMGYTGWLWEDYANRPGFKGRSCLPGETDEAQEEELHKIILYAHQKGYQAGIHATGDRSLDVSLAGFIKAIETYPGPSKRHYVIHGDMITNKWARKAVPYDIGLSLEPEVGTLIYEATMPYIGKRASRIYGVKELLDCGLWVAGGSDCPVTYPNWRKGLEAAVTRRSATTGKKHCPELAVSVAEGIKMFTYNGAYQERFEKVRGSIEINKVADFQVLEEDLFMVEPEAIGDVDVVMTICGGKVVYEK